MESKAHEREPLTMAYDLVYRTLTENVQTLVENHDLFNVVKFTFIGWILKLPIREFQNPNDKRKLYEMLYNFIL